MHDASACRSVQSGPIVNTLSGGQPVTRFTRKQISQRDYTFTLHRLALRAKLTMFKRVDRRRKRKEEEEELGLSEDEREILGLNNTDSSESDSDMSSSSSSQGPSGHNTHSKNKRKRRDSLNSHDKSDDDDDSQSTSGDEAVDGDDILADHLFSIATALKEPIQLVRTQPEAWVCVFCPNKVLKHGAMVKVHEASQARKLRMWNGYHTYHAS